MAEIDKATEATNNGYIVYKGGGVTGSGRGSGSSKQGKQGRVTKIESGFGENDFHVKWSDGSKGVYRGFELDATS